MAVTIAIVRHMIVSLFACMRCERAGEKFTGRKFKNGSNKRAFVIGSLVPQHIGNFQTTTTEEAEIISRKQRLRSLNFQRVVTIAEIEIFRSRSLRSLRSL